ncbi:hypothetical protein AB0O07_09900 [Streptomyces sp. NPDC093085]|uniref:hypothetical protein n=1 Tax=Streptomyces sp. NPDC093085 TaxID=3155068 RepID=UPI003432CDDF
MPPCLWFRAGLQATIGVRAPALARSTLVSTGVNAGLDRLLPHGGLGLPRLGVDGVGLAATAARRPRRAGLTGQLPGDG